ncbi:LOW QUALITY PROTEIN: adenylate kinase 8 [Syngnathus typhle]|uniref:LOW QUALITY PROTEIN: adenylate kinase 8 n=1 Tax=Syngnathus typhle TaxID=161592 RepID=UPI002A6A0F1A|nr:LOW QUALITY PROTEIN: adenylate kinase 8 [Syngnathus typhle]
MTLRKRRQRCRDDDQGVSPRRKEQRLFFQVEAIHLVFPMEPKAMMMEGSVQPLRVPPQMSIYADQHNIIHLVQTMVSSLAVDQPEDPIAYLLLLLQDSSVHVPRVVLLGPPAVGKTTLAGRLCADLGAVHVTMETLLDDPSPAGQEARRHALKQEEVPGDLLVSLIQARLKESDCFNTGWVLDGLPQTRLQARSLQQGGVIPKHVGRFLLCGTRTPVWAAVCVSGSDVRRRVAAVLLVAGEDVLLERHRGRLLDPLTRDVYHETFARPREEAARRAEKSADAHVGALRAHLQRYRCKVTGLSSAYRHILTTVDADQPPLDVYQQALAFLRTRRCSRTPRVLLLGPPGSGKRLQAKMLAEKYKMVDVCCSDLLRWAEADPSSVGEEVRTYVQHNRTVPKSVTLKVFQERLDRADCSQRGWILHHLPCDLQHAKHLTESLNAPNRVFFLELTDDVCLQRTTITPVHPSVHAAPGDVSQCLDNTRSVTQALGVYRTHTAGLQCVFPDGVHVDADQDPQCVFEALDKQLIIQTHAY